MQDIRKIIIIGPDARKRVEAGIKKLADAVRGTLGPEGRHVLLGYEFNDPTFSDDGVTIAKSIELDDEVENVGVQAARYSAEKTNKMAGDGTTTSIVLTDAIIKEISDWEGGLLRFGRKQREELQEATRMVVDMLDNEKTPIESAKDVEHIATISSGDAEIGRLIGEVYEKVGKEGVIMHSEHKKLGLSYEITKGMEVDSGLLHPMFFNDVQKGKLSLSNVGVLILKEDFADMGTIVKHFEAARKDGKSALLVLCDSISELAINQCIIAKERGNIVIPVKAPYYSERRDEFLDDIAAFTGASADGASLGSVKEMNADLSRVVLIDGDGSKEAIQARKDSINAQIEASPSDFQTLKLKERLAKLGAGIGVIRIGMSTEAEQRSKMAKVEDAINAVRVALEEGVVDGCGVALLKASRTLAETKDDVGHVSGDKVLSNVNSERLGAIRDGALILAKALRKPFEQILENTGYSLKEVEPKIVKGACFNARTGEVGNALEMGVIDPVKVTKNALLNSVSVACMVASLDVVNVPKRALPREEGF